ncbi:hypothetical protein [Halorussus caseinilyticus]|uniref:Transcriptional regulator n=1 Tax=Halorussus caseinilyticus TaxID=3034025 RepID=A0ABD5WL84_9EURY|nr:hypothetical protein [Halorussus sp. DT72]
MVRDATDGELQAVFETLDSETKTALRRLAENDPALLRETLSDLGYLGADSESVETAENREAIEVTPAQERLGELLTSMGSPRSTTQIIDLIGEQHPSFFEEYQSAKHRPWMSNQLNALVDAGELGRYRDGRTVLYTPSIADAIRNWALKNDFFVEDLTARHVGRIASDTEMPRSAVREGLQELQE